VSLPELLAELRERKIQLSADGGKLKCHAPVGALTPDLRDALHRRKPEMLRFLGAAQAAARQQPAIVPLQPRGTRPAVFAVAGHNGDVFAYRAFAEQLGDDQPFYGLQPPGLDGQSAPLDDVNALAKYFADQIQAFQPDGPYVLAGFCAGGTVAYELARLLEARGARVGLLAMFACPYPFAFTRAGHVIRSLKTHARRLMALKSFAERREYVASYRRGRLAERAAHAGAVADPVLARRTAVETAMLNGVRRHRPGRYAGRIAFFIPGPTWLKAGFWPRRWRTVAANVEEYFGRDCDMNVMLRGLDAQVFIEHFRRARARHMLDACDVVSPAASTAPLTSAPTLAT
jgi:thioesterase domain-containing protein